MVKIRIGSAKKLYEFNNKKEAFRWVSKNYKDCLVSVLTYEKGELQTMNRYNYNGSRFSKENIAY